MSTPSGHDAARAAADWAGVSLSEAALARLDRYARWLVDEAIPAGGLGPREADRVWTRHLADSLLFAAGLPSRPDIVVDVGSGVGLPGIPLALVMEDTQFWLVDRAGRRTRLLDRVARILELQNVLVLHRDVHDLSGTFAGLTFRGSIPRRELPGVVPRLLSPAGSAVLGLSTRPELPEETPELLEALAGAGLVGEPLRVPDEVLDAPGWLLKITHRG